MRYNSLKQKCLNTYNDPYIMSSVLKRKFCYTSCAVNMTYFIWPIIFCTHIIFYFFIIFLLVIHRLYNDHLLQEPMGPCTRPRISRPRRSSLWRRCGSPSPRTGSPCPSCGRSRCYATSANTTIPTLSDWSTYATGRDTIGRWSSTSYSSTSIREAPFISETFLYIVCTFLKETTAYSVLLF